MGSERVVIPDRIYETVPLTEPVLAYKKDTWGSFGQHHAIYVFYFDPSEKKWIPLWDAVPTKWEISDSRKNIHRKAYVDQLPIGLIKRVESYKSSGNRDIKVEYALVEPDGSIVPLDSENIKYPSVGYVDKVEFPDGSVRYFNRDGEVKLP